MDEQLYAARLREIQQEILQLNNATYAMAAYDKQRYPENFLEISLDTAVRAERIACKMRHLIGAYGTVKPSALMGQAIDAQGITIQEDETNCTVVISIPRLLPRWKKEPQRGVFKPSPAICLGAVLPGTSHTEVRRLRGLLCPHLRPEAFARPDSGL